MHLPAGLYQPETDVRSCKYVQMKVQCLSFPTHFESSSYLKYFLIFLKKCFHKIPAPGFFRDSTFFVQFSEKNGIIRFLKVLEADLAEEGMNQDYDELCKYVFVKKHRSESKLTIDRKRNVYNMFLSKTSDITHISSIFE